ncbi:helix-turn-helix domain-containing protein [Labrys wisconsinensis]|uniref:AraC-like DNA-binding protein n=1 Tax=Labrys wisconsinensis TaxID=425677 RepID=A0ABU0J0C1_9HYPH|nr:helix-turn-helix domain-containing protein [Labrys wisconsinensis]MDQ0467707.1 AraC-like DNA-binding protein [Labrys wisconsinensis]
MHLTGAHDGPTAGSTAGPALRQRIPIGRLCLDLVAFEPGPAAGRRGAPCAEEAAYVLVVPLAGPVRFGQGGRAGTVGAGDYVLLSQMAPCEIAADGAASLLLVRIPAAELRGRLTSVDEHIGRRFGANQQMARLLVDLMRGVAEQFADRPPPNPEALATEMVSFTALAIGAEDRGSTLDVRNARYRLRRRIVEFIESHLGDQDLSPKAIAAGNRISLSYLYSLFNDDDTTVGQFLQGRRLQRAYELLVADPGGRLTVSEIAYQVGFKNVSHFSRTFSRQFGIAPRDARQLARPSAAPASPRRRVPAGRGKAGLDGALASWRSAAPEDGARA